tara:strand:- start:1474 stop:1746 length:273 start_codon:yes stop_codon:yes gene_type:complete
MVKDTELKGEHFSGNNPDMKLYFEKPTHAEIDEMGYCKPITSYKNVEKPEVADEKPIYMDGSDVMPTPNADFVDDKKNYAPGGFRDRSTQ